MNELIGYGLAAVVLAGVLLLLGAFLGTLLFVGMTI